MCYVQGSAESGTMEHSRYLWRGQLHVGAVDLGPATVWSEYMTCIPSLGGTLKMTRMAKYDDLWYKILRSKPCQLSSKGYTKIQDRTVSVHRISSHTPQFFQLTKELTETTKPLILTSQVLNNGQWVEVILAPHCQELTRCGLQEHSDTSLYSLHIIFVSRKSEARVPNIHTMLEGAALSEMIDSRCPFKKTDHKRLKTRVQCSEEYEVCKVKTITNEVCSSLSETVNSPSSTDSDNVDEIFTVIDSYGENACGSASEYKENTMVYLDNSSNAPCRDKNNADETEKKRERVVERDVRWQAEGESEECVERDGVMRKDKPQKNPVMQTEKKIKEYCEWSVEGERTLESMTMHCEMKQNKGTTQQADVIVPENDCTKLKENRQTPEVDIGFDREKSMSNGKGSETECSYLRTGNKRVNSKKWNLHRFIRKNLKVKRDLKPCPKSKKCGKNSEKIMPPEVALDKVTKIDFILTDEKLRKEVKVLMKRLSLHEIEERKISHNYPRKQRQEKNGLLDSRKLKDIFSQKDSTKPDLIKPSMLKRSTQRILRSTSLGQAARQGSITPDLLILSGSNHKKEEERKKCSMSFPDKSNNQISCKFVKDSTKLKKIFNHINKKQKTNGEERYTVRGRESIMRKVLNDINLKKNVEISSPDLLNSNDNSITKDSSKEDSLSAAECKKKSNTENNRNEGSSPTKILHRNSNTEQSQKLRNNLKQKYKSSTDMSTFTVAQDPQKLKGEDGSYCTKIKGASSNRKGSHKRKLEHEWTSVVDSVLYPKKRCSQSQIDCEKKEHSENYEDKVSGATPDVADCNYQFEKLGEVDSCQTKCDSVEQFVKGAQTPSSVGEEEKIKEKEKTNRFKNTLCAESSKDTVLEAFQESECTAADVPKMDSNASLSQSSQDLNHNRFTFKIGLSKSGETEKNRESEAVVTTREMVVDLPPRNCEASTAKVVATTQEMEVDLPPRNCEAARGKDELPSTQVASSDTPHVAAQMPQQLVTLQCSDPAQLVSCDLKVKHLELTKLPVLPKSKGTFNQGSDESKCLNEGVSKKGENLPLNKEFPADHMKVEETGEPPLLHECKEYSDNALKNCHRMTSESQGVTADSNGPENACVEPNYLPKFPDPKKFSDCKECGSCSVCLHETKNEHMRLSVVPLLARDEVHGLSQKSTSSGSVRTQEAAPPSPQLLAKLIVTNIKKLLHKPKSPQKSGFQILHQTHEWLPVIKASVDAYSVLCKSESFHCDRPEALKSVSFDRNVVLKRAHVESVLKKMKSKLFKDLDTLSDVKRCPSSSGFTTLASIIKDYTATPSRARWISYPMDSTVSSALDGEFSSPVQCMKSLIAQQLAELQVPYKSRKIKCYNYQSESSAHCGQSSQELCHKSVILNVDQIKSKGRMCTNSPLGNLSNSTGAGCLCPLPKKIASPEVLSLLSPCKKEVTSSCCILRNSRPATIEHAVFFLNKLYQPIWEDRSLQAPADRTRSSKYIHLYQANNDDIIKLKCLLVAREKSYGSLQDIQSHGGQVYMRPSVVDLLLESCHLQQMCALPHVRFSVYVSLAQVLEGRGSPVFHKKWLLLLHHTALLEETLGKVLKAMVDSSDPDGSPHQVFVPALTLATCAHLLSQRPRTKTEEKLGRILKSNLLLLMKCVKTGVGHVLGGSQDSLCPGKPVTAYKECLRVAHRSLNFAHRHTAVLIGAGVRVDMSSPQHSLYRVCEVKEVLQDLHMEAL